jgi:site-specific DNA recombinase
MLTIG